VISATIAEQLQLPTGNQVVAEERGSQAGCRAAFYERATIQTS
jgi:hypothetical protein